MIVLYATTIFNPRHNIYTFHEIQNSIWHRYYKDISIRFSKKKKSKKGFFTYLHFPYIHVYTCQTMGRTQRKKDQDEVPPKPHIDFDPVMTTRFCFDSKNEDLKREARN